MYAVIAVAGKGIRMQPLTVNTPKCLLPILNKPLLQWTLEALHQNGISDVVLVIDSTAFGEQIKAFATQHAMGMNVQFAVQTQQLGTAHVVKTAAQFVGENEFVFLAGDDLYGPKNIAQLISQPGLTLLSKKVSDPEKWGILQVDGQNNLQRIIEKPSEAVGDLANIECMKLDKRIFAAIEKIQPSSRGELEITDALTMLTQETPIRVVEASDYWLPIGYPWHLLEAAEFFLPQMESKIEGTVEENVHIAGKVVLPKSSVICAGSYIDGNVIIGENAVIGPNARLRGNVVIGDDCLVGFAVEVKNSVIGAKSHVPHLSYIGDSVLGNDVNFAGQSTTANWRHDNQPVSTPINGTMTSTGRIKFGTVIGDGAHLGIGTLIYPGRKVWPNKTTLPGAVVDKDIV